MSNRVESEKEEEEEEEEKVRSTNSLFYLT